MAIALTWREISFERQVGDTMFRIVTMRQRWPTLETAMLGARGQRVVGLGGGPVGRDHTRSGWRRIRYRRGLQRLLPESRFAAAALIASVLVAALVLLDALLR